MICPYATVNGMKNAFQFKLNSNDHNKILIGIKYIEKQSALIEYLLRKIKGFFIQSRRIVLLNAYGPNNVSRDFEKNHSLKLNNFLVSIIPIENILQILEHSHSFVKNGQTWKIKHIIPIATN